MKLLKHTNKTLDLLKYVIKKYNLEINNVFKNILSEEDKKDKNIIFDYKKEDLIDRELYYIEFNSKIIGFLYFKYKDKNTVYISGFYIFPEFQKKGYGSKAMKKLEKILKKELIKYILLETRKEYFWAINFYKKYGFKILNNQNIKNTYFSKFYKKLVKESTMLYVDLK